MTQSPPAVTQTHARILLVLASLAILINVPVVILLLRRAADHLPTPDLSIMPAIRSGVLDSTLLLQVGIAGANRRDCVLDYDEGACSEAFHFGLGTILNDHQILTHDHFQVIGDDAGTLAEIQKYRWFKVRGRDGEFIISTAELSIAPESAPIGMIVLQVPAHYQLSQIGMPAVMQSGYTDADYMGSVVYYPRLNLAIDSIYPYDAGQLWQGLSVGAAQIRGVQRVHDIPLYIARYADAEQQPLLNGDCGGGTFVMFDGAIRLAGTHNYVTPSYYLVLPVGR